MKHTLRALFSFGYDDCVKGNILLTTILRRRKE